MRGSHALAREFLAAQVAEAKGPGRAVPVHLKATMMKVSDCRASSRPRGPRFFPKTFAKYGVRPCRGRPEPETTPRAAFHGRPGQAANGAEVKASFEAELADGPGPGDGRLGQGLFTNLHVPVDFMVDASMPGHDHRTPATNMWGPGRPGRAADTPQPSCRTAAYARGVYSGRHRGSAALHGAFDPAIPWARSERAALDAAQAVRGVKYGEPTTRPSRSPNPRHLSLPGRTPRARSCW
ncbi:NADP-dependent isocitrate dehydrogenase [Kitasatospora albolonga]|uniref:NADP-dependent isocitrate dehydrogenase n=1 Tax=Kitasatospora albolonga TaxID=68173 RepID=UPI0031E80749